MSIRSFSILGLCLLSSLTFAEPPSPEAIDEYHAARKDMDELQHIASQLQVLLTQADTDKAKGRALAEKFETVNDRMYAHLDSAIAGGHAVAMYQKATLLMLKSTVRHDKTVCELYGHAAERGLMAGALAYTKCVDFFPPTDEYTKRLKILQSAVDGQDPYLSEYPLLMRFPYCFPKHKPALKPGEDAIEWVTDNARPQALSAEDFRAEGYYTLAMTGPDDQTKELKAGFLKLAFSYGCREDSARIAKSLGVTVPKGAAGVAASVN